MPGHFTFFTEQIQEQFADFDEVESRHMINVLRYYLGDIVNFTDGKGHVFNGKIIEVSKKSVRVEITERTHEPQPLFTLCLGILKSSDRMEWMLEKTVELGIKKLVLLNCKNSERSKVSLDKLKKVAISALKQSHGAWLPEIEVSSFKVAVIEYGEGGFIAHCNPGSKVSINSLGKESVVFIGPEGDFSSEEIELAQEHNLINLSLGTRILRTETAAVSVCAAANLLA